MLSTSKTHSHRNRIKAIFVIAFFLGHLPLSAYAENTKNTSKTTLTMATLYSNGNYGLDSDTSMNATIFKLNHRTSTGSISASLPYLNIKGLATVLFEDIDTGELFLADVKKTRSGLGDVVISADYTVKERKSNSQKMSIGAAIKLPTGDEDERLSNGTTDWSVFTNARTRKDQTIFSGQIGYQIKGDSDSTHYNNRVFITANAYQILNKQWGVGIGARYKQASLDGQDDQKSINAFISYKFNAPWSLSLRLNKGFTDSVADYSAALQLRYQLK